ncbi:bifunctional polysaccharide deacetylase/glycosyltransferase family 2 protein [Kocuria oceani]|uniref:bifunctional polysaccharide deacetylase/glycosyltransferase family 2 protein n=1 Tax=Kocuria oceani TaxID=988827 RepID=UPI0040360D01
MPPVFFDPSGKRWYRILAGLIVLLCVAAGAVSWILPRALDQTWEQPLNQDIGYPEDLLDSGNPEAIPVVGELTDYAFVRMTLVERTDGRTVLKDPYSDQVFRVLTAAEADDVGDSPYALERFGRPAEGQLMLTFDDGPDGIFTPEILDVLESEGVPATFFNTGTAVVENPDVFRRTIEEGHMVGNHTMTHLADWEDPGLQHREELIGTDRTMRSVGNYGTRLFRFPEGNPELKPLALLQAQQLGYLHVNMDLDTWDWKYGPDETVPLPELDGKGHIAVMHAGGTDRTATVAMLRKFIAEAKTQGYTFTTLAPILPDGYLPTTQVEPEVADDATAFTVVAATVMPGVVNGWLYWFWTGSLVVLSVLCVVLALYAHRRRQRRQWRAFPDEELPLVTVVLPVFNEEPVVSRTLDALRTSDYPALEVVAVDDGSTDGTLRILQDYARDWPQLKVLTQENGGKSVASNQGILIARGEIVITLDGDTLFEPDTIRMLARHFYDHDGTRPVGAVAGQVKVGNRRNLLTMWQSLEYLCGICINRMASGVAGAISVAPGACTAWRRTALQQAGGYSHDTLAEDMDLTLSIQRLGYAVVQENEAVAWTEAPMKVRSLTKQRVRWTYGNLQALRKHSEMILNPKYGALGMAALPYNLVSFLIHLVFLPLVLVLVALSLLSGDWGHFAVIVLVGATVQAIFCLIAMYMVKESPLHLLIVPLYRFIFEPLRAYVIYASLIQVLKGRVVGWYKPERTNSVIDVAAQERSRSAAL